MRYLIRRLLLGFGALLLTAGIGLFLVGHELLHALIAYAVENKEQGENAFKALAAGVVLGALGMGVLAAALPSPRPRTLPQAEKPS